MQYEHKILLVIFGLFMTLGLMSGCMMVKPYEREYLADDTMIFDPDPLEASWHLHVREVLEGGRGGFSGSGGGCGCR